MVMLFGWLACLPGQFQTAEQLPPALRVTAELVGKGHYESRRELDGYYVKLVVKNTSATGRQFFLPSCTWQDCWTTNKLLLALWREPCQQNIIRRISLQAGQQVNFYGFLPIPAAGAVGQQLKQGAKLPTYSTVKFAFAESPSVASLSQPAAVANRRAGTVYWSNTVLLTFANNDYHVLTLPAK